MSCMGVGGLSQLRLVGEGMGPALEEEISDRSWSEEMLEGSSKLERAL